MELHLPSPTQKISHPLLGEKGIELFLKRDDLIHDVVSGNKWRKLKYSLEKLLRDSDIRQNNTILTFGGAFSNHIVATAFVCKEYGIKSIGVIRGPSVLRTSPQGENSQRTLNHTLKFASELGMQLHFVSREEYRRKNEIDFINELKKQFGDFYLIPEGGANYEGILGCREILEEELVVEPSRNHIKSEDKNSLQVISSNLNHQRYDFVCCAAGTGTTLTGLLLSLREGEKLVGFPALKNGMFLKDEIEKNILNYFPEEKNKLKHLELICDYHFGGYAKVNDELKNFVKEFFNQTQIQLDYIYNGKMMFGLFDLIKKDRFPSNSKILAIHTGGVQGNQGFETSI